MASKEELLEHSLEELKNKVKELEIEGRSALTTKDDHVKAILAHDEANEPQTAEESKASVDVEPKSEDVQKKVAEDAPPEAQATGYASDSSDVSDPAVVENLSSQGKEAVNELDDTSAALADVALDASGPLHVQAPSDRIMTGAVSEAQAEEQKQVLANKPEGWVGEVPESGFNHDGTPNIDQPHRQSVSVKDNLADNDDRQLTEVRPEDRINFPPPVGQREFDPKDAPETAQAPPSSVFSSHIVAGGPADAGSRGYNQKSQFYTDGLSGGAEHNLERAYEFSEVLQSNDPRVRKHGDESVSEAALANKSDKDLQRAEWVKTRDDDPAQVSRNQE